MKKNSLKSLIVIFAFSTLSGAEESSLEEQLRKAAFNGDAKEVERLLKFEGINVNQKDEDGWTVLHLATCVDHTKVIETLLATKEIDVNMKENRFGQTAFHIAAANNSTEIIKLFLKNKRVRVNEKSFFGNTALHLAARYGYTDIVRLLLAHGKNAPAITNQQQPHQN